MACARQLLGKLGKILLGPVDIDSSPGIDEALLIELLRIGRCAVVD